MAAKGVLVSDPSLFSMTPTRWVFEYAGLISTREQAYRTYTKTAKEYLTHFLGLDMVPPIEDQAGNITPSPVDYLPLTAFMNPKFFQDTMGKRIRLEEQEAALREQPSTANTMGYDEMLKNIDDLIPIFDEIFDEVDKNVYNERLDAATKAGILVSAPSDSSSAPPTSPKITIQDDDE